MKLKAKTKKAKKQPEEDKKTDQEQKPSDQEPSGQEQKPADQEQKPPVQKSSGKKKLEKKIYVIVCAALIFLLAGVVALILFIAAEGEKEDKPKDIPAPVSDAAPSDGAGDDAVSQPETTPDGASEPDGKTEDGEPKERSNSPIMRIRIPVPEFELPEPEEEETLEDDLNVSLSDAVGFIEELSPSVLGLSGESMDQYEILSNQYIIPVDNLLCSQVMVYNRDDATGTNQLVATLLVTRGAEQRLFRIERETGEVVELDVTEEE